MESVLRIVGCFLVVTQMFRNHECNITNGDQKLELCKKDCFRNYFNGTNSQAKENVKTIDIQRQCSEKCSRYALGNREKYGTRKSLNEDHADRVLKVSQCQNILKVNTNDTAENLGKARNVFVEYRNDSALVTWEPRDDIPMNKTWLGYLVYWFTFERPPPWSPFCKIYLKNQTSGVIRNGFGWNSSYDLNLDVLLYPSKNPRVDRFHDFQRPIAATTVPAEVVKSQTQDLKQYVGLGGGIGGILFVIIFGVLLFRWRKRHTNAGDVFITYSRKNEKFVLEELLPLLDIYKINIRIDFIDFEPGVLWMDNLMECIFNSSKILIVMSKHYLASTNCKKELKQALYNKVTSSIVVLRIDSVSVDEFPKALRNGTFIDYADSVLERNTWKSRVIKALKRNNEVYSRSVSLESKEGDTKEDKKNII